MKIIITSLVGILATNCWWFVNMFVDKPYVAPLIVLGGVLTIMFLVMFITEIVEEWK